MIKIIWIADDKGVAFQVYGNTQITWDLCRINHWNKLLLGKIFAGTVLIIKTVPMIFE